MLDKIQSAKMIPIPNTVQTSPAKVGQESFSNLFKTMINNVNDSQIDAEKVTQKLINGEQVDLHNVMIASQKALITLQATVEIRNKVIEAYQEVMRMQV